MGFMVLPFLFPPKLDFGIAGPEEAKNLAGKDPPPVSDPFSETNFEEISRARQAQLPSARIANSSSTNAVSFSSARTIKRFRIAPVCVGNKEEAIKAKAEAAR